MKEGGMKGLGLRRAGLWLRRWGGGGWREWGGGGELGFKGLMTGTLACALLPPTSHPPLLTQKAPRPLKSSL